MQNSWIVTNITIIAESETISNGTVVIKNGVIEKVIKGSWVEEGPVIDGEGMTLLPGFIDVHIHGANGHDVMDATQEAIKGIADKLPEEGTTSFLATTMTQSLENISLAVKNVGEYIVNPSGKAEVIGIHLEGPFISPEKAGAQHPGHIMKPSVEQFQHWQKESHNCIRLVTMAPEVEGGILFISQISESGVVCSIGHTNATFEQANEAVEHGARHVTHLYNQMSGIHHREPGVVGAAFMNPQLMVEMIVDHIHSHSEAVRLAFQNVGPERAILVTDAMRAKCLPEGTYDLGGQDVVVKDGEARLIDHTLAGSILTLDEAVRKMKSLASMSEIALMSSANPAKQIGVYDRKGSISEGKDADLVLMNEEGRIVLTLCRGEIAYDGRGGES
ncbi:N-acetylglucosamine-6-phosphate deacetylase [Halobacillus locisalis]|uniref:N-acetylglucosamine-6-phosphate deacetylase n=1 Tax=Halobacillus locisalis TaxID=220753 RepID=A0A838CQD4_9BACI|nr:N-acetylglucosamine-6-phosphate deacetylase [Halobacillus locisalis]MBA2174210.1 N-acetylglucosamine-6-phosphate deacetylase [Halobacillus locisalis]